MNKQLLIGFLLLLTSLYARGQYSGTGPVILTLPSDATGIQWYKNGVLVPDSTAKTFTTSAIGTYYATYAENVTSCTLIQSNYFVLALSGTSITLDGKTNNGGGTGYQWTSNGVNIPGATTDSYTTSVGGLFVLKYNNGTCDLATTPYHVFLLCGAGAIAPTLSAVTKSNTCPTLTVDLTTLTASNKPVGTAITWHTGTPATDANKVATSTAVGAGTYYAAFYDANAICYSPATSVTAVVTACCAATATPALSAGSKSNVCPATTVDLSSITATNTPSSTTLAWFTTSPATPATQLNSVTGLLAGTYYAAFIDSSIPGCISPAVPVSALSFICCMVLTGTISK